MTVPLPSPRPLRTVLQVTALASNARFPELEPELRAIIPSLPR